MGWVSAAGRRHADLAWIGFGVGNEFRYRLGRNGWMHGYQKGPLDNPNDRDVADEIEIQVVIESCIDCGSSIRAKKRIAIGWRAHDCFGGYVAGGACPVLDDKGLTQPLGERLAHQAYEDIRSAARG